MSLLYIRSNKSDSLLQTVHLCPAYSNGHPACLFLYPPLALPSHHLPLKCSFLRRQSRPLSKHTSELLLRNSKFITPTGLMRYLCRNLMSSNLRLMTQNQYPSLMSYLLFLGVLDESEGTLLALIMSMVINTLRKLLKTLSGLAI